MDPSQPQFRVSDCTVKVTPQMKLSLPSRKQLDCSVKDERKYNEALNAREYWSFIAGRVMRTCLFCGGCLVFFSREAFCLSKGLLPSK